MMRVLKWLLLENPLDNGREAERGYREAKYTMRFDQLLREAEKEKARGKADNHRPLVRTMHVVWLISPSCTLRFHLYQTDVTGTSLLVFGSFSHLWCLGHIGCSWLQDVLY